MTVDLYYKSAILANLALARSVNYNRKVPWKLKHTLHSQVTTLNYDRKIFIVLATSLIFAEKAHSLNQSPYWRI